MIDNRFPIKYRDLRQESGNRGLDFRNEGDLDRSLRRFRGDRKYSRPDNSMGAVVKRVRRRHVASGLQSGYNAIRNRGFRAIFSCTLEPRLARTRSRFMNSLSRYRGKLLRVEHESRRSTLTFHTVT